MEQEFGVPQLDRVLPAIPRGARLLLVNDPGIEAEPFLYQSADSHLRAGKPVVYVVLNRPPDAVRRAMTDFGFETAGLIFVDAFSPLVGGDSGQSLYQVDDPSNPEQLAKVLETVASEHGDSLLIIDSLSTVIDQSDVERFVAAFPRIFAALGRFQLSACAFTVWPYEGDLEPIFEGFEALVKLKTVEDRVIVSQYFTVERAKWRNAIVPRPVLYKALKPGGVFAYIPKIVVTGPFRAGKTTFVQSLSETAVSVNRLGTTVALDHGHVTIDGLTADVFGTPGQARFDPILRIISGQALGVVVVVDSTKPDTFPRAREMMRQTWKQGLPIIIAANKQDSAGALPVDEVKRLMEAPVHVRVIGCSASSRDTCLHVMRELIDQIMGPKVIA